jgi:tetratricopeptide (TPR) repeat protein
MLVQMKKYNEALEAYESNLKIRPNRFNSLYGAGLAAEKSGNTEKANLYYRTLLQISASSSNRPELKAIK